ncbi:MAG: hypothetical protein C0424_04250 [Sphingobacteriaceae bacterium]|nr:hypothetical protein [Sphingobacteriaceae bacterium]
MNTLNQFLLKKEIEISMSMNDVVEKQNKRQKVDFTIQKCGQNHYNFMSKMSLGVGSLGDFFYSPINVDANYVQIERNKTKVILYTTWRVDLVVIIGLCFFVVLWLGYDQLFNHSDTPILLYLIMLLPPAWFGFIFREQEKELISKVEKFLKSL